MSVLPTAAATSLALALAGACSEASTAPRAWPDGTVLAVEDEPITADEVDRWLDTIVRVEPTATRPAQRRFALTNIVLPRVVGAHLDPAGRERARAEAEAAHAALLSTGEEPPLVPQLGTFRTVGLDAWGLAQELAPGEWSELFEYTGGFGFFRLVDWPEGNDGANAPVRIESARFPYLDPVGIDEVIQTAYDQLQLSIVDPAWEEIVPAHYTYRMRRM